MPVRTARLLFVVVAGFWMVVLSAPVQSQGVSSVAVDYADSSHVDDWLRHPVFGDPSFDTFQRASTTPVFRGSPPLQWPVNGFYFIDPVSRNHYLYVGDYAKGYWGPGTAAAKCILFRSADDGQTWTKLAGAVLAADAKAFDADISGGGHLPDVSVVYFNHRYHLVYDWERTDHSDGGIAYAWAEKPEGPFHRALRPILREDDHANLVGRYSRPYAATLIRRRKDWLITGMMDDAPFGWAMFVITAKTPEGPWSNPVLVRNVESAYFHPPLMEGYPAFTDEKYIYAPATSVAKNRDFQCIFKALIEQADQPSAWSLAEHGSLWHSEDKENEYYGIWGQTFSGALHRGTLHVLFPSKDRDDKGSINTALRAWNAPLGRGFHMSAHTGPALTILRHTCDHCALQTRFHVRGTARLLWDYKAPLGPDKPRSDATLHKLMLTRHSGIEMNAQGWRVVRSDEAGSLQVLASGSAEGRQDWTVAVQRNANSITILIDGKSVWKGEASKKPGGVGWFLEPNTYLSVSQFSITGPVRAANRSYLYTEGWLDSAEDPVRWNEVQSTDFRYGIGAVSRGSLGAAKWSVVGHRFILYSPRGPEYGTIRVTVDGHADTIVNLHALATEPSVPVWTGEAHRGDYHAIVIRPLTPLRTPLDSLDVTD